MKNRIGIVGGGQLGRMLAFEAKKLGFHVTVIDPTTQSPAAQVVDEHILAGYSDEKATRKLASQTDFITIELEHIDTQTLKELVSQGATIHPSPESVDIIKNKFLQKEFLNKNRISTADFLEVKTEEDILNAAKKFKFPLLLKTKYGAFDGRGNVLIRSKKDIPTAYQTLSTTELYVEKYVPFIKELAVVIARGVTGEIAVYPVVQTIHENNICHLVIAPAPIDIKIKMRGENLAKKVMKSLKGAGVFAIEMFLTKDNEVLVNEIAPRVHNSGHFSIEACATSQFQQHIRAITGLPLGSTRMIFPAAVMINILGERNGPVLSQGMDEVLKMSDTFIHIYGKKETKLERKMGHITVVGDDVKKLINKAKRVRKYIKI